jgi:hypothetical protein
MKACWQNQVKRVVLPTSRMGFLEIENYIYPILHGKIGLVNCAVDGFNDFWQCWKAIGRGENSTNVLIMADITRDEAIEGLKTFKESESIGFYELMNKQAGTCQCTHEDSCISNRANLFLHRTETAP